jgi:putative PEP-CTERM system histidine kinase
VLLHGALTASLLRGRRASIQPTARLASPVAFTAAVGATVAWGAAAVAAVLLSGPVAALSASLLDLLREACWLWCLLSLLQPHGARRPTRPALLAALLLAANLAMWLALAAGIYTEDARPAYALALALPVLGLVLVEQLWRNATDDARWSIKPFCLALALAFAFDIYFYSQAALFGHLDADAVSIRGVVHAACAPLLWVASKRRVNALGGLRVSRIAAFHTAALLLVGLYLLFLSAIGYYVRESGGNWGQALQLGLLFVGAAGLVFILLSGSARASLRVFIGKHFFAYRYDYRAEWLRFTAMLSAAAGPHELGVLVIRGLADMVESPAGALWTKAVSGDQFVQTARWNMPQTIEPEAGDSALSSYWRRKHWIIDVDELRAYPERYEDLRLPTGLAALPSAWLLIPLRVDDELIGFVALARARAPVPIDWEVRDLLKTASRQAAVFLAQMHTTEALLEARKFEAFNRMSAFVVHDLKNIVTQLSLMLKNAKRLHANPEFQQDMLMTVENSLEKMRQLMLQLREGQQPAGSTSGVDLTAVAKRLAAAAAQRGRSVELQLVDRVATRGHEDRIERVLGHVVQNALDATPAEGRVWLRLERASGRARVVVGDSGRGMSAEFVQTRLFRPFNTTKEGGMGIGAYESFQYLRELGGSVDVDSELGRGTVVTMLLPVFEMLEPAELT